MRIFLVNLLLSFILWFLFVLNKRNSLTFSYGYLFVVLSLQCMFIMLPIFNFVRFSSSVCFFIVFMFVNHVVYSPTVFTCLCLLILFFFVHVILLFYIACSQETFLIHLVCEQKTKKKQKQGKQVCLYAFVNPIFGCFLYSLVHSLLSLNLCMCISTRLAW